MIYRDRVLIGKWWPAIVPLILLGSALFLDGLIPATNVVLVVLGLAILGVVLLLLSLPWTHSLTSIEIDEAGVRVRKIIWNSEASLRWPEIQTATVVQRHHIEAQAFGRIGFDGRSIEVATQPKTLDTLGDHEAVLVVALPPARSLLLRAGRDPENLVRLIEDRLEALTERRDS